ncbi:MAG: ATP-binding protein [Candidatus Tectimicrobiota bacterium]
MSRIVSPLRFRHIPDALTRLFVRLTRGLRQKLLVAFTGLVLGLTIGLLLIVESRQRTSIIHQVEKRGVTIAVHLAAVSTNSLVTYNFVALEQAAEKISQDRDVLYTIILDRAGRVAAYSGHDEKQGTVLHDPVSQRAMQANSTLIQRVGVGQQSPGHYDIAVPVFVPGSTNKWGTVRVGLSLREMQAEIMRTRLHVLLLGVLGVVLSIAVAAYLARRIVAPLQALAEGTVAVARGDLAYFMPIQTHDEIAVLAQNFNHMTSELRKHRTALEETNAQLDQKVSELSRLANYNDNILASMTSGLLTLDAEGHIATFNAMAETITGMRYSDIHGQHYQYVFAHNVQLRQVLEASRLHHASLTVPRLEFARCDGPHVPLALRTAMLQDRDMQGLGLLAIFEDLSPIQTLERRLHRADRLASLGQMAAGVAHEIKNPLASIRTFAQLVKRKHQDSRFIEKFDRIVPQELDRINFIVEELLELARPARLHCVTLSLQEVLQRVLGVYSERFVQQDIHLKTDLTASIPPLIADAEQLYRCFGNIVLNAIEAMPTGGELTILCRPVPKALIDFTTPGQSGDPALDTQEPPHALDLYTTDVEVLFQDTGLGIPPEQLDEVFTPFWTTKPKGTGLGLALTHKIIEEHGGSIQLSSIVNQGTSVTVRLPAATHGRDASAQIS